jgi:type IV pilus assembly protein PilQ
MVMVCAGYPLAYSAGEQSGDAGLRRVTSVKVVDSPDMVSVHIQGDRLLTYTSVKQMSPLALVLYFSDTSLDTSENVFTPPTEVIQAVSASEITRRGQAAKIQILLKRDAFYEITRKGTGLKIAFSKTKTSSSGTMDAGFSESKGETRSVSAPSPEKGGLPGATILQSVYAARFGDNLKVFVGADGMISNYRSFTINAPPRIVFDIFNIKSPYEKEKIIPVNTQWVRQIRYYSYPDRVRVILETEEAYLSAFSAYPIENGLLIQMGSGGQEAMPPSQEEAAGMPDSPQSGPSPSETLSRQLQSVYATQLEDSMLITVRGNGMMKNYKSWTEQDPERIMVDIFDVMSPYQGEQLFPVDTRWVKTVRHQGYPDKVQLTIETREPYLSAFTVYPDKNGLVVRVGPAPESAGRDDAGPKPISSSQPGAVDNTRPAWINQIEFTGQDAGKSTLLVGTTRPVQYEVREISDKTLELEIFNTRIPKHQERPLITDRFESAVDRIMPARKPSARDSVFIEIQLREAAPYFVEQDGGVLRVNFEASSISPKPLLGVASAAQQGGEPLPSLDEGSESRVVESPSDQPLVSPAPSISSPGPSVPPPAAIAPPSPAPAVLPAAPAPSSGDTLTGGGEQSPQYTGEKIALDFYETDIRNVFRILREVSGKNFAVEKDVTGKVTLTLAQPVPWDQVLDLVLKMNKLGKSVEGDIIRIATRQTIDEEDRIRQEKQTAELTLKQQQKELEPLFTEYLPVSYSNAGKEIQPHIETILTKDRGKVSVDSRTNVVIVTDTPSVIEKAKDLIRKLDRVTPQVIIEARIVEASTNFSRQIGTTWEMGVGVQEINNEDVIEIPGSEDIEDEVNDRVGYGPQRGYNELGGTYGYNMAMNFPLAAANAGTIGFNFMRIAGTPLLLNAKLSAMESQGEGKIVSAPKVMTLDNKKAVIKQGLSYPYQTVEDGEVNVEFKDVDLLLEVTPHVTPDNRISMNINITKNDLGDVISGEQSFTTKEAQTELLINDGDTVVIGGIIKTTERENYRGLPGLGKIPILGWFFKAEGRSNDKEELLIFITPRIVQLEQRTVQY